MPKDSTYICPQCGSPVVGGGPQTGCPHCKTITKDAIPDTLPAPTVGRSVSSPYVPAVGRSVRSPDAGRTDSSPHVPGYEILDELGRGGMGVVYKARHIGLNRVVALKMILSAEHAGKEAVARFKAEAEAVAQLKHPNIIQVYDIGEQDGRPYFSMEFVEGGSLAQRISGQPQPPKWSAEIAEKLALAMHVAHSQGIVHRDLKPANVLLVGQAVSLPQAGQPAPQEPKIMDFGLAKRVEGAAGASPAVPEALTQSGAVMGTPQYMAPEQASGEARRVGPPADVYALGAILYTMLTGKPPFSAETALGVLRKVLNDEPAPPTTLHKRIPPDLETICLKCLQKEPQKRYASAQELAADLRRFLNSEPIVARPSGSLERATKWAKRRPAAATLIGVSAVALVALIGGGVWYSAQLRRANAELRAALDAIEKEKQLAKQAEDEKRRADQELSKERRTPEEKEKEARDAQRVEAQQRFKKALAAGKALELDLGGGVKLETMLIPAGKFLMGSPESEKDRVPRETQHEVTITKPFYMGMYEVTQAQYEQVMGTNPSNFKGVNLPVESVSWDDAQEFCKKASNVAQASGLRPQSGGLRYTVRLPTEAEWEYACRAGTTTRFYTGDTDDDLDRAGWWNGNARSKTHAVGGKVANAFGLYDTTGNVWEWCQDWYGEKYYAESPKADPSGAATGTSRVLRGGAWYGYPGYCRSASRYWGSPVNRGNGLGFRVVVSAGPR